MAKDRDEDFRERRRRREEEDEEDLQQRQERGKSSPVSNPSLQAKKDAQGASAEKIDELMARAEPLIDQVHSLYNQFLSGVEKNPPRERRQALDQLMYTLQLASKPTPTQQFRYQALNTRYVTYRELWDRMVKDREAGRR